MAVYAISDLHLSLARPKPMDIFGEVWANHPEQIRENWIRTVTDRDTVLMPGDLSWAMRLSEARQDLNFVRDLPGRKVLIRGNHDYWWSRKATNQIQRSLGAKMALLQGTSTLIGDRVAVAGTRGWRVEREVPGGIPLGVVDGDDSGSEDKVLKRELDYFERGLASIPDSARLRIAMLHYPPFDERLEPNAFAELLGRYHVDILVYGHVHLGAGIWLGEIVNGVRYHLVSADVVGFVPQLIVP